MYLKLFIKFAKHEYLHLPLQTHNDQINFTTRQAPAWIT